MSIPLDWNTVASEAIPQYPLRAYGSVAALWKAEDLGEVVVAGYASPQVVDREKHLITREALAADLPRFLEHPHYRNAMLLHSNVQVGEVLPAWKHPETGQVFETKVDDVGLFCVVRIRTDSARPKIVDKVLKDVEEGRIASFSISADAPFESRRHECVDGACFWVIDRVELYEVTLCETPVNQDAKFALISKAFTADEYRASAFCQDGSCPLDPELQVRKSAFLPMEWLAKAQLSKKSGGRGGKTYLGAGERAPEGADVVTTPRGARYYVAEGKKEDKPKAPKGREKEPPLKPNEIAGAKKMIAEYDRKAREAGGGRWNRMAASLRQRVKEAGGYDAGKQPEAPKPKAAPKPRSKWDFRPWDRVGKAHQAALGEKRAAERDLQAAKTTEQFRAARAAVDAADKKARRLWKKLQDLGDDPRDKVGEMLHGESEAAYGGRGIRLLDIGRKAAAQKIWDRMKPWADQVGYDKKQLREQILDHVNWEWEDSEEWFPGHQNIRRGVVDGKDPLGAAEPSEPPEQLTAPEAATDPRSPDQADVGARAGNSRSGSGGRRVAKAVDPEQFRIGMEQEGKEHGGTLGGDPSLVAGIVLDHLAEDPEYYSKVDNDIIGPTVGLVGPQKDVGGMAGISADKDELGHGSDPKGLNDEPTAADDLSMVDWESMTDANLKGLMRPSEPWSVRERAAEEMMRRTGKTSIEMAYPNVGRGGSNPPVGPLTYAMKAAPGDESSEEQYLNKDDDEPFDGSIGPGEIGAKARDDESGEFKSMDDLWSVMDRAGKLGLNKSLVGPMREASSLHNPMAAMDWHQSAGWVVWDGHDALSVYKALGTLRFDAIKKGAEGLAADITAVRDRLHKARPLTGSDALAAWDSVVGKATEAGMPAELFVGPQHMISKSVEKGYDIGWLGNARRTLERAIRELEKAITGESREKLDAGSAIALDALYEDMKAAADGLGFGGQLQSIETTAEPELDIIKEAGADQTLGHVEEADALLGAMSKDAGLSVERNEMSDADQDVHPVDVAVKTGGMQDNPRAEAIYRAVDVGSAAYEALSKNYPEDLLGWVKDASWSEQDVPLDQIRMAKRPGGARDWDKVDSMVKAIQEGKDLGPVVLVKCSDGMFKLADGYHRTKAFERAGVDTCKAYVAEGCGDEGPWDSEMHEEKLNRAYQQKSIGWKSPGITADIWDQGASAHRGMDTNPRQGGATDTLSSGKHPAVEVSRHLQGEDEAAHELMNKGGSIEQPTNIEPNLPVEDAAIEAQPEHRQPDALEYDNRGAVANLSVGDEDARAYGRLFQSLYRRGLRDKRYQLAVLKSDGSILRIE